MDIKNEKGTLHYKKCDVSKNESVQSVFQWIETEFHGVNILINCAGIIRYFLFVINRFFGLI